MFGSKWSSPAPRPERRFDFSTRRNGGDWTDVEAHDFPHPVRELELDFARVEVGATPEGWSLTPVGAGGMTVASDGQEKVVRARAAKESLTGLYTTHGRRPNSRRNFDCPQETERVWDSFSAM